MKRVVSSDTMKKLDLQTISEFGMSSMVLMERASMAVVEELHKNFLLDRVLVLAGTGNNGGDGIAIARLLHLQGIPVAVYIIGDRKKISQETREQIAIAKKYQVPFVNTFDFSEYTTIVDAIFGIGLSKEVTGEYKELIENVNQTGIPVMAVDIPSGIHGTTGQVLGVGIQAKQTVTFAYGKIGLYLYPGAAYAGNVTIKDIGIYGSGKNSVIVLEKDAFSCLPKRMEDGNKGSFGKVLVVAGSKNMSGACYFSAKASMFAGAGMVRIFTPEHNRTILQQQFPEAMLTTWETEDLSLLEEELLKAEKWADVVVVGPGLGVSSYAKTLVDSLLQEQTEKPLIVDADALNIISENTKCLERLKRPCILTPHMGEMERLSKIPINRLKEDPVGYGKNFSKKYDITLILKDARTLTFTENEIYLNIIGNNGMATAGSGDTLTGIIAGLLAQGLDTKTTAPLGVYLHAFAGDMARATKGAYAMTASDILDGIVQVMKGIENGTL